MRNRYLDLLRAAAIVRVIVYHLFGWPWLSLLLPAMGVMFALAGSLAAASLDKRPARKVVPARLRRLLPPLWLLGLIAVPVMLGAGWATEHHGEHPFDVRHLWHLAFWIFPLGDPPGSDRAADLWDPLWYIRAYVWFILLSPVMYLVYRRIGWLAVIAPVVGIAVLDKTGLSLPDTADAAMWDFVTFGACWMTGFAHHDGRLRRLRPGTVVLLAVVLGALALYWQNGHQGEEHWDLNDVPESQALWSLAFVLLALRWEPSMTWLPRVRPLDRLVTLLNARAVTIYLWHNTAITLIWPLLSLIAIGGVTFDDLGHGLDGPVDLIAALLLTMVAVLAFGWVEDLAAKRRPRLWPTGSPALRPATTPAEEAVPALAGAHPVGAHPTGAHPTGAHPTGAGIDTRIDTRLDLPEFADRRPGHRSAASAMHRGAFRRTAPWAAEIPAAGDIGPVHGPEVTGAIWPITGTESGAPAGPFRSAGDPGSRASSRSGRHAAPAGTLDADGSSDVVDGDTGPGALNLGMAPSRRELTIGSGSRAPARGSERPHPGIGGERPELTGDSPPRELTGGSPPLEPGGGSAPLELTGDSRLFEPGGGSAPLDLTGGTEPLESGGGSGLPEAAGGFAAREPAGPTGGRELEVPPGDWPPVRPRAGEGRPDWFRRRRGGPPDQTSD